MSDHSKIKCIFFQDIPGRSIDGQGHQRIGSIKEKRDDIDVVTFMKVQ